MKTVRIALIAGSALLFAAGATGLAACGSDDNTGFPTGTGSTKDATAPTQDAAGNGDDDSGNSNPGVDSGGSGDDDSTGDSGNTSGDDDSGSTTHDSGTSGTDSGCSSAPFVPSATKGNYCPFSAVGSGSNQYCGEDASAGEEVCCETAADSGVTSYCASAASGCHQANTAIWECSNDEQCGGKHCCVVTYDGGFSGSVTVGSDSTCGTAYLSGAGGTQCLTTCGATDLPTCTSDGGACANGKTCIGVKPKSKDIGVCN